MRKRGGERVLGPYEEDDGWRVIHISAKGHRDTSHFPTLRRAEIFKAGLLGELETINHTTTTAIAEYKRHLEAKGNKPDSIRQTIWALEMFFFDPVALDAVTDRRCARLYEELRLRPLPKTGQPPSVDSHRSMLAQSKSFLEWCRARGWIRGANPLDEVKGIGKRRPRGKTLGKSGNELRVKEARAWFLMALFKGQRGDHGATAALTACLLGMRASEIVSRRPNDVDDDQAHGDLLWIPCSKTPAGRRTLEVPDVLRPLLVACREGKGLDRHLFEYQSAKGTFHPHHRTWILDQVHRICDAAEVPRVTAHAMRGLLATLTAERGLAGHLIAATLGHEDQRTTMTAYAAPGSQAMGVNRRGLKVLEGGVQVRPKSAK